MWPKVKTVIDYRKELPKSKQPARGKPGTNVSYDRLCAELIDAFIPLKLLFIHDVAEKLNNVLTAIVTDKPMNLFFGRNIEMVYGEVHCKKYTRKSFNLWYFDQN